MQRAEKIGLGIAVAGHVALFAALSLGLFSADEPPVPKPDPVQVSLIGEVAPLASAPEINSEAPAPAPADEIGDPLEAAAEPLPQMDAPAPVTQTEPAPPRADPKPVPKPDPKPAPKPKSAPKAKEKPKPEPKKAETKKAEPKKAEAKPAAKAAPKKETKPAPDKASSGSRATASRSRSFADSLRGSIGTDGKSDKPVAAAYSETTRRQIDVSIKGEIAPYWKRNVPTGVDIDQLRTVLRITLNKDGSLAGTPKVISQTGKTASNEPQQKLHIERAIKSVRQAAPFKLPAEYYDNWKSWDLTFRTDI